MDRADWIKLILDIIKEVERRKEDELKERVEIAIKEIQMKEADEYFESLRQSFRKIRAEEEERKQIEIHNIDPDSYN